MTSLGVYLNFPGTCEEALNFYKTAFAGADVTIQRFGETPVEVTDETRNLVMHSEFKAGDIHFMASDCPPGMEFKLGTNVTLSLQVGDAEEQTRLFDTLSQAGQVGMPLQDTFWGARFGMLTDRFGINWMLNHELKK